MRGDQCPFDHGLDPVILSDVSLPLPEALKYSQPPPGQGAAGGAGPAPPHFNPLLQPPPPRPAIVGQSLVARSLSLLSGDGVGLLFVTRGLRGGEVMGAAFTRATQSESALFELWRVSEIIILL